VDAFVLVDPAFKKLNPRPQSRSGLQAFDSIDEIGGLQQGDVLLLAVKPQVFGEVAPKLRQLLSETAGKDVMVLSVMAGMTCAKMQEALGGGVSIVRAMPNLGAMVRQGASAYCLGPSAPPEHGELARAMLKSIGPTVFDLPETQLDAFTAVAGSGPAYLFYLAEAMVAGAVAAGMDAKTADQAVRQTLLGAATMLKQASPKEPATLRANVTSKGGTTETAIGVFEEHAVREAVVAAVMAARLRARELSR
jgi:pyrroline-5-carboxylate reductase